MCLEDYTSQPKFNCAAITSKPKILVAYKFIFHSYYMFMEGQFWPYSMLSSFPGPRLKKQALCEACWPYERGKRKVGTTWWPLKLLLGSDIFHIYSPLSKANHMISLMSMARDELSCHREGQWFFWRNNMIDHMDV